MVELVGGRLAEGSNWDYEVDLTDLKAMDSFGNLLCSKKATVNKATGDILGLVSPSYNLIQNKTIFDLMQEVEGEMALNLESINVCKNKAVTIFKYGLGGNDRVIQSDTKDDVVKFGIELINSFDSSKGSSRFRAFANRLSCSNGQTIPMDVSTFYFSSFKNLTADVVADELRNRLPAICNTAEIWNTWATIIPSRIKVGELISGNLGKGASKSILEQYDNSSNQSIWTLYNLVTYYITHEVQTTNPSDLRMRQYDLERVANKFYTESLV